MYYQRPNAWIQTYTGKAVYPLEFAKDMICIEDIAWSLSHQCRYAGHCNRFYSVAEHSLHLVGVVPGPVKLAALLHDASEAYLIDVPRPIKWALTNYSQIEFRIKSQIGDWSGVKREDFDLIKEYDLGILSDEQSVLMPNPPQDWHFPEKALGISEAIQKGLGDPEVVCRMFLETWRCLKEES